MKIWINDSIIAWKRFSFSKCSKFSFKSIFIGKLIGCQRGRDTKDVPFFIVHRKQWRRSEVSGLNRTSFTICAEMSYIQLIKMSQGLSNTKRIYSETTWKLLQFLYKSKKKNKKILGIFTIKIIFQTSEDQINLINTPFFI